MKELDGEVDSKVEEDYSDDEEANDISDPEVLHLVCEDEQGVARRQNAQLIECLIHIRLSVLIGPELNDVDQVELGEQNEGHDLQGLVVAQQDR